MAIEVWPIALRAQLVRAFRPGEASDKEAPFRTLRKHGWASPGMSIVCRARSRAAGRLTVFSTLNIDAARLARDGRPRDALVLAKAAARIEHGPAFVQLKNLISGTTTKEAATALQGTTHKPSSELLEVLRSIAVQTRKERLRCAIIESSLQIMAGWISATLPDAVVLETSSQKTYVPRDLAESANRTNIGDLLALVTERFDRTRVAFEVLPAIAMANARHKRASPFGRSAPIHHLTAEDARLLRRTPAPLRVRVPVAIGE